MKRMALLALASNLLLNSSYALAKEDSVAKYIFNLGQYLGYDLCSYPSGAMDANCLNHSSQAVSQTLLNFTNIKSAENYLVYSFLGAILVNSSGVDTFIPSNAGQLSSINAFANLIFSNPAYNNTKAENQVVSVNPLIDQPSYQTDPVSQAVLNIVATPDLSYCSDSDSRDTTHACLSQNKIMINVLGNIPTPEAFFSYNYNKNFLAQLNSDSLLAPLMYTTTNPNENLTSSTALTPPTTPGLTAQTQAQQAANFIRYAIGAVAPMSLASRNRYSELYDKIVISDPSISAEQKLQAEVSLVTYLTGLRVFAAQNSVGISNLYSILAKRLPQKTGDNTLPTSQALSEFNMATWRLTPGSQWTTQINQASNASVQKEIATLLAEINYQLYLSRQQQERLLLTNSMLLIQNSKMAQPEGLSSVTTGKE